MDNVELSMFLQAEYMENPMLEYTETKIVGTGKIQESNEENKWNQRTGQEGEDLRTFLKNQINQNRYEKKIRLVIEYMIECIEDSGYFKVPIDEIARICKISNEEAKSVLDELKELEPVGIFTENLQECLLKQVESLGIEDEILEKMIREYLPEIAERNLGRISRALKISTSQVRKYILFIETLNPRPVMGMCDQNTEYIIPDIVVRKEEKWVVELNDSWMGNYEISDYYLKLMKETVDEELKRYFGEKSQRVRLILQNVEQRRHTLESIMKRIVELQENYLEGNGKLKPMTMTEIAEQIGVHPSTVSRAVKGKYVQCPCKTLPLKEFFSQGIQGETQQVSTQEIKEVLQILVAEENKKKPYSDEKLVRLLKEKGIDISRRTVSKYREEMGIRGSFARKEL